MAGVTKTASFWHHQHTTFVLCPKDQPHRSGQRKEQQHLAQHSLQQQKMDGQGRGGARPEPGAPVHYVE
ncbi:hypothetical protein QJQ45_015002 [Haematococcus lacustris]|nr:hypothetical protein QJQ45_015002 [Haematococcus lacustris]